MDFFKSSEAITTHDIIQLCIVIGAMAIMAFGLYAIFGRMKEKNQGFGPNTLKALGIILFIPTILILATTTNFQTETLAALLGTIAGYVLSTNKNNDE